MSEMPGIETYGKSCKKGIEDIYWRGMKMGHYSGLRELPIVK
jgi:hypothetical protein